MKQSVEPRSDMLQRMARVTFFSLCGRELDE